MRDLSLFDGESPVLITIQRALVTLRFTTWSETVTTADNRVFDPLPGCVVTGLSSYGDGSGADNVDVALFASADGPVASGEAAAGLLDDWPITIEMVNPNAISAGTEMVISGTIGSCSEDADGVVTIAANSQLRRLQEKPVCEYFTLTGREILGDDRCKIPLLAAAAIGAFDVGRNQDFVTTQGPVTGSIDPGVDGGVISSAPLPGLQRVADAWARVRKTSTGTVEDYANLILECTTAGTTAATAPDYSGIAVGDTVTDGTVTFTVRNSWMRYARGQALDPYRIQLTALPDPRASNPPDDRPWYALGGLLVRSGFLSGFRVLAINTWDPTTLIATLFLPIDPELMPPDTQFEIYPGCDLTATMCHARFDNIDNLRAEDLVPPSDYSLTLGAF